MINKHFDLIEKADIDALVANEKSEGRTLEYKDGLPGNLDSDKIEFLADVSSFANASGGDIIYGVREKRDSTGKPTGIPESADGLESINADGEILRLESIIRDGIAPRITGLRVKQVQGFPKGSCVVLRVPKSWASPHMVTFKAHSRFYSRTSSGKYPLDVAEIRSAFALSESLPQRIRQFRDDRLCRIVADETPVALEACPKIVLHILPVTGVDTRTRVELSFLEEKWADLLPIHLSASGHRYNFDGFLTYSYRGAGPATCDGYVQLFRNGAIEAVDAYFLRQRKDGKKYIPSVYYERHLIEALQRYLKVEGELGFEPPLFVMLSLLGVKGYEMAVSPRFIRFEAAIDRDTLLLPDAIIEDYKAEAADILRPAFDAVWQAAGFNCSENYNNEGKWAPQP